MKVLITGSSGFLGTGLIQFLSERNFEVYKLVRHKKKDEYSFFWDPANKIIDPLPFFDVVIHLAGENIISRWSEQKKTKIYQSRVQSTQFLAQSLKKNPPNIFLQASAIGYYGNRGKEILLEESKQGGDFLAKICQDWENASSTLNNHSRIIKARLGVVLSPKGGALKKMLPAFKCGLGGKIGSGKQYMSWIALEDFYRCIEFCIKNEKIEGPVNFVSPFPITNEKFTEELGSALKRPTFFTIPEFFLKLVFGEGSNFLLNSNLVIPQKLEDCGFVFLFPKINNVFEAYF